MRTKHELAHIIASNIDSLSAKTKLSPLQQKTLRNIAICRTAELGYNEQVCEDCGTVSYSYNSCGDRHCPKCQASKQAFWVEDLINSTLKVKHFHVIFTLPHLLNQICLFMPKAYYDLLFASVWNTLKSFGYTHYGVETGAIAVLHTWGQNLSLHPHIHCIVPAAGYSLKGEWKNIGNHAKFLYPVTQVSKTFKGKFLDSLKRILRKQNILHLFESQINMAYQKAWVVHCEPALANASHVIKYLGQYTHRVAITNDRILSVENGKVTFIAKDYRDNGVKKILTLDGDEFLRRFALHILPARFVKIRRFGIYNHTTKRSLSLQFTPEDKASIMPQGKSKTKENTNERLKRLTGFDASLCPVCKKGRLLVTKTVPRIRSPSYFNFKSNLSNL